MSTHELYTEDPGEAVWQVPASGAARFSWEYDDGRDRLLALYQKGKDKQWDAQPSASTGTSRSTRTTRSAPPTRPCRSTAPALGQVRPTQDKGELRQHYASWQFSQFLHGEQGAMVCAARIVESVPDLDAKFYSATQTMDEARHAEIFGRFLHEKIGMLYPINDNLQGAARRHPAATPAGTCPTSACRCSSRAWRWPPSA